MISDTSIRTILLQAEESVPQGAWEFIEHELTQIESDAPLKHELLSLTEEAPSFIWESISVDLDDAEMGREILQMEKEVPPFVWENIQKELTEGEFDSKVASALLSVEESAPGEVWNKVEKEIQEQPGRIIQFKPNLSKVFRIAAVLMFGLATWSLVQLFKKSTKLDNPIAIVQPTTEPSKTETNKEEKTQVPIVEHQKETEEVTTNSTIKKRVKQALKESNSVAMNSVINHNEEILPSAPKLHYKTKNINADQIAFAENQYLMVLNESGDLIRVSKKISTLKCAKQEAEMPVDAVAVLQNRNCDEQIKRWQEKMAYSTSISPSAGYIDINDLLNSIEK
jgi:hypothetical protein